MSVMPKSSRPSRALVSPDSSFDTSASLSTLQHASSDYYNEAVYTTPNNPSTRYSPRFPTERKAPNYRLHYPNDDSLLPSGGSAPQARASPDLNDTLPLPHAYLNSAQAGTVGPNRVTKNHSRRQLPGHIPRPRNAFILYRSWYVRQGFLSDVENDHREISRIVGKIWRQMSSEEQAPWRTMAEEEKAEHARMYPNYKYSPNPRRDAATISATSRNAPVRPSASRPRKTKAPETLVKKRIDAVARAFVSGSRKLSLIIGARNIDEQIKAEGESDVAMKTQACTLAYPTSPSSSSAEPECPNSPVYCGAPSINLAPISNQKPDGRDVPGMPPGDNYEPAGEFSLAACSTFSGELSPDSVQLLPPDEYYRSETFLKTALRPYFDVDAGLGPTTTCDDTTDLSSFKFSTDSNLYSQSSYTSVTPNHHRITSGPELSPFDCIALEGTLAGHPDAISFGTSVWDPLLTVPSSSTTANSSLYSDPLSNFSWSRSRDYSTTEKEHSASSTFGGDTQSHEYGLFSERCNPDSPITTDGSDISVLTPETLSCGAPSPPLSLTYPSPTYPRKHSALFYRSWETDYEDMDAYERALGDIKAEIDDYRFF
ncbi:hypothetical protein B0J17DRAFT_635396 [Rhizoctonia solani]|nr:hypothetical protein B0J17DRAFT_635396 [Rhizoctonia solani]